MSSLRDRILALTLFLVLCILAAVLLDLRWRSRAPRTVPATMATCPVAEDEASPARREWICTGRMPVNVATPRDLEVIDGIGPARARAIVIERERTGAFGEPGDLERVHGIGPVTAEAVAGDLSFRPPCEEPACSRDDSH